MPNLKLRTILRRIAGCAGREICRQRLPSQALSQKSAPLGGEILENVAIGSVVGLAIAAADASTALVAGMAVLVCVSVGALIGLLLWCESDELPADPVTPPTEDGGWKRRPPGIGR